VAFPKFPNSPHNIHRLKMSLTTPQSVFRVHRQNHAVCIRHYPINSSTMHCWNAVHLCKLQLRQN